MTIALPDTFDTELGLSDYDSVSDAQPIPAAILTNRHIDVRSFDTSAVGRARTMDDLDGLLMSDPTLDTDLMSDLEQVGVTAGEAWSITSSAGVTNGSLAVGKIAAYSNWRGLEIANTGIAAVDVTVTSDMAGASFDISAMDTLSLVIPTGAGRVTPDTVTVTLDSSTAGTFADVDFKSAAISFAAGTAQEWNHAISTLTAGAGVSFDLTTITGVRIRVAQAAPESAGRKVTIMAVRAYATGYDPDVGFDVHTRFKSATVPVTFDAAAPSTFPDLVRGTSTNEVSDPRPQDATGRLVLSLGALADGGYNSVDLVFREDRDANRYIRVRLEFRTADARWTAVYRLGNASVSTSGPFTVPGGTWTSLLAHGTIAFEAILEGQHIKVNLYPSDSNETLIAASYTSIISVFDFASKRGRVGWGAALLDRDVLVLQYNGFASAFSVLVTRARTSITPVAGCRLAGSFSADTNLFDQFVAGAFRIDSQRTLSAAGSYQSSGPIASNLFLVEDFTQTYLHFDMWVPGEVTGLNTPRLVLRSPTTTDIPLPALNLQGNQWNHVAMELSQSTGTVGGVQYQLFIERGEGTGTSYLWNVDNITVGRRNVNWAARAIEGGDWISFGDLVNDDFAGIHFAREQRGKALQIRAEALTAVAWVSYFELKPKYAELGRPLYYH